MTRKSIGVDISIKAINKFNKMDLSMDELVIRSCEDIEIKPRKRLNFQLGEKADRKIKEINKATRQPKWKIIEELIKQYNPEREAKETEEIEKHIEPTECPECGSDDLLISHSDYSWYCYECESEDNY